MKRGAAFLSGLAAMAWATAALACLPPPPGIPDPPTPTAAETAHRLHGWATDIAYGVVTRGEDREGNYRFRVLHVYKGNLRPGQTISVERSWGFDSPPCILLPPPPASRGDYGVIAFETGRPTLSFVADPYLQAMFETGLIRRASPAAAR